MKPAALLGAILGGAIGTMVWAAIGMYSPLFGLIVAALSVGAAVGLCSYLLGGRGPTNGFICAIVAILAIFGGKILVQRAFVPEHPLGLAQPQMPFSGHVQAAIESLNIVDFLLFVLAVWIAFRIGSIKK